MTHDSCGASHAEWQHFADMLGGECLPTVCDRGAKFSKGSKLTAGDLGRAPCYYNSAGLVVGVARWPQKRATDAAIKKWMRQAEVGIMIQCRTIRAFDIDVDTPASAAIFAAIEKVSGVKLPKRGRANSHKVLLAFRYTGELGYRSLPVAGGMIELLGTGRAFVAAGQHRSGARYSWDGGLPSEFPTLDEETLDKVWKSLSLAFGVGVGAEKGGNARKHAPTIDLADPVANYLLETRRILREENGILHVACPWKLEHTSGDDGDGSTSWFPAGLNGYQVGHFKCLHAHCANRTDDDFKNTIGFKDVSDFPVLNSEKNINMEKNSTNNSPTFTRDKAGLILASLENIQKALECGLAQASIAFDCFMDEIIISVDKGKTWRPFTDSDYTKLRINLERRHFNRIAKEDIKDLVAMIASDNPIDSATIWLDSLTWDGKPRVKKFLTTYFNTVDSAYTEAVSLYSWTALAGRILQPGVKADMIPILVGAQGLLKSSVLAALVPDPKHFTEINLSESDADLARKIRGCLVGEINELRGLHTRDLESIKAFATRTHEKWVPKFKEFATSYPRRCLLVGSTNTTEILSDSTGNRRWLPIEVGRASIDLLIEDRDQLWAEGAVLFKSNGVMYDRAEALAEDEHENFRIIDPWENLVLNWLDGIDRKTSKIRKEAKYIRLNDVATGAIHLSNREISRLQEMRISSILKALGYRKVKQREGNKTFNAWRKNV